MPVSFTGARRGAPHEQDETGAFYIKDCARAIQLIQMAGKLSQRIYNVSGERPISYKEFIEAVKKVVPEFHLSLEPGHGPGHRPNGYLDISRIKEELGYRPQYDGDRGVEEYIHWLRKYPE